MTTTTEKTAYDTAAVRAVIDRAKAEGRTALAAPEAKRVADAYRIPVPKEGLATSADAAATLAAQIGFPVVLKIVSPQILHKTDAGGVVTGVAVPPAARAAYERIVTAAQSVRSESDDRRRPGTAAGHDRAGSDRRRRDRSEFRKADRVRTRRRARRDA